LSNLSGKKDYEKEIEQYKKGLIDIMEDFDIKIPFANFVSIASMN